MIKKTLLYLVMTLLCQLSIGQENYSAFTIPKELKENANAVVRTHDTKIEIFALDNMIITQRRVVTVLNRFGEHHADSRESYDDSRSIQRLSLIVLDSSGEIVRKYKKNDFKDVSEVSNGQMYMDDRIKYVNYHPNSYPYTIIFESTVKEKSTAFLNSWYPVEGYYVSVENSSFELINHTDSKYKFKGYNLDNYEFDLKDNGGDLMYKAKDLNAVKREELSPSFSLIMPWVRFALNDFELKGVKAKGSNWKEFGLWQFQELLADRDIIDETTKEQIAALISDSPTTKEKIKRIYNYVQNNTRYVGVQLGIGGWQPIEAQEVDKVKYGDCKGLTNYTKALLKSQGIESNYAIVFAGNTKRSIDNEFSSMQGNHAFLNVPLVDETIWLECTSQTLPFGFLGDLTDDRDVLVVTPEGGVIKHTPIYTASDNKLNTISNIKISDLGKMNASIKIESYGLQYNDRYDLNRISPKKQKAYYLEEWDYLNGIEIINLSFNENKDSIVFEEQIDVTVGKYATKVMDKLLVPINPFNRYLSVPKRYENRKMSFQTKRSFTDTDIYIYEISDNFDFGGFPEDIIIESEFGTYKVSIQKIGNNKMKYIRELTLKEGVFEKEKYNSYRDFIKRIVKKDNSKFILTKKA